MEIVVLVENDAYNFLQSEGGNITWTFTDKLDSFFAHKNADAYFDLRSSATADYSSIAKPIFINNMVATLAENNHNSNIIRINAWPGFIETELWELAGVLSTEAKFILEKLHKKYVAVPDEPGFISARIIAMIINEAFFALDDNVSTKKDIDIAMKLGTNYPYGPFEWCEKIGVQRVYKLLVKLSLTDNRFLPSAGIVAATKNI